MRTQLSKTAFWDVDLQSLNDATHSDFIIARVFQYGLLKDLQSILKVYTPEQINHAFKSQRGIDEKAVALARILGFVEEE